MVREDIVVVQKTKNIPRERIFKCFIITLFKQYHHLCMLRQDNNLVSLRSSNQDLSKLNKEMISQKHKQTIYRETKEYSEAHKLLCFCWVYMDYLLHGWGSWKKVVQDLWTMRLIIVSEFVQVPTFLIGQFLSYHSIAGKRHHANSDIKQNAFHSVFLHVQKLIEWSWYKHVESR